MGSGKSTFGRELASKFRLPFIDLDDYVSQIAKMRVPEIFETLGEAHFRQMESHALRCVSSEVSAGFIATGGGTPCYYDNLLFMRQNGVTIYLQLPFEELVNRLNSDSTNRPLLAGQEREERKKTIRTLFDERVPFYQQADLIIDPRELSARDLLQKIEESWEKC